MASRHPIYDFGLSKAENPTGKRKPRSETALTSDPSGSPSSEQTSPEASFASTVASTPKASDSPDSFSRVVSEEAVSAQHSRRQSDRSEGQGLVRSRTSSFAESKSASIPSLEQLY